MEQIIVERIAMREDSISKAILGHEWEQVHSKVHAFQPVGNPSFYKTKYQCATEKVDSKIIMILVYKKWKYIFKNLKLESIL